MDEKGRTSLDKSSVKKIIGKKLDGVRRICNSNEKGLVGYAGEF